MKKLVTLLLAAGMVLGSFAGAQAIDFKVKGEFQQDFGISDGLKFVRSGRDGKARYGNGGTSTSYGFDNFEANSRIRFQIDAVASENLSGTVFFEIGQYSWGKGGGNSNIGMQKNFGAYGGGSSTRNLGAGVRYAYIDWFVPQTDLKFRMGLQYIGLPSYTFSWNPVCNYEGTGVVASYKFNDNVSLTAFWARPLNDNAPAELAPAGSRWSSANAAGEMDNVDMFGLIVPLSFDGFKIAPYGIIGAIGPRAFSEGTGWGSTPTLPGIIAPRFYQTRNNNAANNANPTGYATAWWLGFTGEITAADPFRFAWEGVYGSVTHPRHSYLNRSGWYINLLAEYKLDWGVPGLYFWWASGDDSNPKNGSERLPMLAQNTGDYPLSNFGFSGSLSNTAYDGAAFGQDPSGTWGIGLRLRDMSFLEDLKHTLRVHIMGGTNSPTMAKYILGKKNIGGNITATSGRYNNTTGVNDFYNNGAVYMTTQDYAVEINFDSSYKIYENLELVVELGYMHLWLDQSRSVWGAARAGTYPGQANTIRGVSTTDAVKANVTFMYRF